MTEFNFYEKCDKKIVLGLGFFDCVHKGHLQIVAKCCQLSKQQNCESAIMTFTDNLYSVLGKSYKLLYTYQERKQILLSNGVDMIIGCPFDSEFSNKSSEEFLQILLTNFSPCAIVCGYDYAYGKDGKTAHDLEIFCQAHNIPLYVEPRFDVDGERVSTTKIRALLENNRIKEANELLSREFSISGDIVEGRGVGAKIGFPTANLDVSKDKFLPKGVFAACTVIEGVSFPVILNIGAKPTFKLSYGTVEAHVINFNGNLYGKTLTVYLLDFLRNISRFNTVKELTQQLKKDCENATKIWSER